MATAFSALYDKVVPYLPGCPLPMVFDAVRETVIDLCERSLCYRQELQEILVLGPTSTTTTAAASSGATAIVVDSITDFNANDTITVVLSDTTRWRGHVSGTPAGSTINLDGQLNDDVESGASVTKLVYLYPITLPSGTAIAKGLRAWLNDNPIDPISQDDLDNEMNNTSFGWVGVNWRTDVNLPSRFYFPDDTTVGLLLAPNAGGNLRIEAALKPSQQATAFPDWIAERYEDAISCGVKAKLMLVPKKPYSDKEMGAYYEGQFNGMIGEARIRTARANTRAPLRTHTVFGLR